MEQFDSQGRPAGMEAVLIYAAALFDQATAEGFITRLVRVLREVVADPDIGLDRVEVVDADERRRTLVEWNDTARPVAAATVPELFSTRAARTPEAVAVVSGEEQVSYAELEAESNRLARYLIAQGVGPESLVAVVMDRSPELVTALLAVMKAGGAYLPVDPEYPSERITSMMADAAPVALLTTAAVSGRLDRSGSHAGLSVPQWVVLDDSSVRAAVAGQDAHALVQADRGAPLRPEHPAYVIYTSGSTGAPKGVSVAHTNVVALLQGRGSGSVSTAGTCGPGSIPLRLTSRCGSCGARCCTAGAWWWFRLTSRAPRGVPAHAGAGAGDGAQPDSFGVLPARAGRRAACRGGCRAGAAVGGVRR
ncbi:hypothetical protein SVIO_026310 [Streptomyces violaceusniger]|uniref:AMP-dependent synthetase/ligase domain-containing protein n=1 Tax=Streptomyces violaceusniger TaxID=68280 RepID=A0A4D4L077_STRVO|nr:hypothetical protein SVIO_026310 [Streptomyces violaceusniger]